MTTAEELHAYRVTCPAQAHYPTEWHGSDILVHPSVTGPDGDRVLITFSVTGPIEDRVLTTFSGPGGWRIDESDHDIPEGLRSSGRRGWWIDRDAMPDPPPPYRARFHGELVTVHPGIGIMTGDSSLALLTTRQEGGTPWFRPTPGYLAEYPMIPDELRNHYIGWASEEALTEREEQMSTFTAGQRVRLTRRYEIDQPGEHSLVWDDIATVGDLGTVRYPNGEGSRPDRQIVDVTWDRAGGAPRRVWAGCLEVATQEERRLAVGDRVRISDPAWAHDGHGFVQPSFYGAVGTVAEVLTDDQYRIRVDGIGQVIHVNSLTLLEEEATQEVTESEEVARLRADLERLREAHQEELEALGRKAMILGRETDMCGVLEKFCRDNDIPVAGLSVGGTVTVTYRITGDVERSTDDYAIETGFRVDEPGGLAHPYIDNLVVTDVTVDDVSVAIDQ